MTDLKKELHYDLSNKCDCSDDDNCGCVFPNNMSHDFDTKETHYAYGTPSHAEKACDCEKKAKKQKTAAK